MLGLHALSGAPLGGGIDEAGTEGFTATISGLAAVTHAAVGAVAATIVGGTPALTASVAGVAAVTHSAVGVVVATVIDGAAPIIVPMVPWDIWAPYVLPYAPGCPDAAMEFHVRQAAIEFCRFTRVWQSDLNTILCDGVSTVFSARGPAESDVGILLSVAIKAPGAAPVPAGIVTPADGLRRIQDGDLRPCAFSDGMGGLVAWPAQAIGVQLTPRAVLLPSALAAQCPESLFAFHASDIAAGALSTLLAIPKQDWTDLKTAAIQAGQFAGRKSTVSLVVQRGSASSTRKSATRWF